MWKEKVQEYEGQIIDDLKGLLSIESVRDDSKHLMKLQLVLDHDKHSIICTKLHKEMVFLPMM